MKLEEIKAACKRAEAERTPVVLEPRDVLALVSCADRLDEWTSVYEPVKQELRRLHILLAGPEG